MDSVEATSCQRGEVADLVRLVYQVDLRAQAGSRHHASSSVKNTHCVYAPIALGWCKYLSLCFAYVCNGLHAVLRQLLAGLPQRPQLLLRLGKSTRAGRMRLAQPPHLRKASMSLHSIE